MRPPRGTRPSIRDLLTVTVETDEVAILGGRGYAEFEIDIEDILRTTLPTFFEKMTAAPLTEETVDRIPPGAKGAYLLLHGRDVVYAGKTDTRHGFRDRLGRHSESIQHRVGLDPRKMAFKAVRIMVFSAFDVEAILIDELRAKMPGALPWNNSGFGSNDPGRRRDGQIPANFDKWFPIDIDRPLEMPTGRLKVADALQNAKSAVPYLLRFQEHGDLVARMTLPPKPKPTMRSVLTTAIDALPPNWQATVLHGRVIMYWESRDYDYMVEAIRKV
ncbi:GIY-YIG nuclease family protein [Dankookia sp. GCM10030260]|uniref:GIY-YIG nuclease family protein n=1 Tax=Dankookia sp. GCM10030260 TaxID=3273390 RepID=UPI0036168C58